jgi:hypothetical protein
MRPIPPESVSPEAVKELKVQGSLTGVRLAWGSPVNDRRGKELQELDGDRVERKVISRPGDTVNSRVRFEKLAFVEDRSISDLLRQRELLRSQDKPAHRAKIDPAIQSFEYVDSSARPGEQYLYRVVPQSYYGDGAVQLVARVLKMGRNLVFGEVELLTSGGELAAHTTTTYALL